MKILRKNVSASSNLGMFTVYPFEEFEEAYPDYNKLWNGNFLYADLVWLPNSESVPYIGISYKNPDGTREKWIYGQNVPECLKKNVCVCKQVTLDELKKYLSTPLIDISYNRQISAAQDLRTFDALTLQELKETNPDIYFDYFHDIRHDVDTAYISKNPECEFIGALDTDGDYYIYNRVPDFNDDPGWYQISFDELFDYLA